MSFWNSNKPSQCMFQSIDCFSWLFNCPYLCLLIISCIVSPHLHAKYFTPLRIKWLCSTQYLTWRRYVYDRCISSIVWLDEQSPFVHPDMLGSHLVDQEDRPCHWLSADPVPTDHSPDRSTVLQTKQTAVLWWFHTSWCGSCPTNKQQYNHSIITLYS